MSSLVAVLWKTVLRGTALSSSASSRRCSLRDAPTWHLGASCRPRTSCAGQQGSKELGGSAWGWTTREQGTAMPPASRCGLVSAFRTTKASVDAFIARFSRARSSQWMHGTPC
jgi:hypothetical protein